MWRRSAELCVLSVVLVLSSPVLSDSEGSKDASVAADTPAAPEPSAFARASAGRLPQWGEINTDRVNLRAGIGEAYRILATAEKGHRLLVQEERLDWYRVLRPDDLACWIHSDYVQIQENTGTLTGDRVNVRIAPDMRFPPVDQLDRDDTVRVLGKDPTGVWIQIQAPEGVSCWVTKKFVTLLGETDPSLAAQPPVATPPPTGGGAIPAPRPPVSGSARGEEKELYRQALALEEQASSHEPWFDRDYSKALEALQKVQTQVSDPTLREAAAETRQRLQRLQEILADAREAIQAAEQDDATSSQIVEGMVKEIAVAFQDRKQNEFVAEGWVESMGRVLDRPGTHRLLKAGQMLYYLQSDLVSLSDYELRLVRIRGDVVEKPGWSNKLILVTEVVPLDGTQQQRETSDATPVEPADVPGPWSGQS